MGLSRKPCCCFINFGHAVVMGNGLFCFFLGFFLFGFCFVIVFSLLLFFWFFFLVAGWRPSSEPCSCSKLYVVFIVSTPTGCYMLYKYG